MCIRDSLHIIDISMPETPALTNTMDGVHGVAVAGSYAYAADWGSGLLIIDLLPEE